MSSFIKQGGHYEWLVTNDGHSYGKSHIMNGTLTDAVCQNGTIGNVIARQLNLRLWNVSLNAAQPLELYVNKVAADGTSTQYAKGVYFIDTISASPYSEYCEVTAFDALLKTEVVYLKEGEWTSTTDNALVTQIANDISVDVEANTAALLSGSPITISDAPSIGESGTTSRQILGAIAVLRGGNWIINDDDELELIRFADENALALYAYIGADGNFYADTSIPNDACYWHIDGNGDFQAVAKADIADNDVIVYINNEGNLLADKLSNLSYSPIQYDVIDVGNEVSTFDVSPTEVVSKVELQVNGNIYRSPELSDADWEALDGRCFVVSMAFMGSQALADSLYNRFVGLSYVPHEATKVYIDPTAKIGSCLHIKNDKVFVLNRTLDIGALGFCGLSSQPTMAVQSAYPYIDPVVREVRQKTDANYTAIQINSSDIVSLVKTFNEELGINIAPLTSSDPTDIYDASSNPNGYWAGRLWGGNTSSTYQDWITQLSDGWYHIEGTKTLSSPLCFRFEPVPIPSLSAESLTLMMEIKNASYTGTINFGTATYGKATGNKYRQYLIQSSYANPTDGTYYIPLNKAPLDDKDDISLFTFGTDAISTGEGLNLDIRLSLYIGSYDGVYVPWSPNSYNSRVQQTANGILISLTSKITQAEAQQLVDNYGESVTQYLEFANGTLRLGESNSKFKALLSNTKLSFTGADGQEVAWISNNQLFISEAIINGAFSIRNNPNSSTYWRQYVDANNIFKIKKVVMS